MTTGVTARASRPEGLCSPAAPQRPASNDGALDSAAGCLCRRRIKQRSTRRRQVAGHRFPRRCTPSWRTCGCRRTVAGHPEPWLVTGSATSLKEHFRWQISPPLPKASY